MEYIGDYKLCQTCFYYRRANSMWAACDYIGVEGHSRIFGDNGRKRLEKGYCDKYKEKKSNVRNRSMRVV